MQIFLVLNCALKEMLLTNFISVNMQPILYIIKLNHQEYSKYIATISDVRFCGLRLCNTKIVQHCLKNGINYDYLYNTIVGMRFRLECQKNIFENLLTPVGN